MQVNIKYKSASKYKSTIDKEFEFEFEFMVEDWFGLVTIIVVAFFLGCKLR